MSYPSSYPSGVTYMLTRRCSERRFFLIPTVLVFRIFAYVLAVAAARTGMLVHAVCVMGNHYHLVVTDPSGTIADFYHYLHEFTAKPLNASRGRWENMWSCEKTSRVRLEDFGAVEDQIRYTLCNPVSSLLVSIAKKWPGLRRWWADDPLTVKRPSIFFRSNGPMPETATLTLVPPPHLADEKDKGVAAMTDSIETHEKALVAAARKQGKRFVGLRNIRRQRWSECPTSFATRRNLSPRVATRCKWRRIEAIQRDQQFIAEHAEARRRWLAGNRDVIWPHGTYQMRVRHNVICHPPPAA